MDSMNKNTEVTDKDDSDLRESLIQSSFLFSPLGPDEEDSLSPSLLNENDNQNNHLTNLNPKNRNCCSDEDDDLCRNYEKFCLISCLLQIGPCVFLWGINGYGDYLVLISSLYLTTISTAKNFDHRNRWENFIILFVISTFGQWIQQITSLDEHNHDMYSNDVMTIMITTTCCFLICQYAYSSFVDQNNQTDKNKLHRIIRSLLEHWRILSFPIHFTAAMNLANYIVIIFKNSNNINSRSTGILHDWFIVNSNKFDPWTSFFGSFSGTSFFSAWTIKLNFHLIQALFSFASAAENNDQKEDNIDCYNHDKMHGEKDFNFLTNHEKNIVDDTGRHCEEKSSPLFQQSTSNDSNSLLKKSTHGNIAKNSDVSHDSSRDLFTTALVDPDNSNKLGTNGYINNTEKGNSWKNYQTRILIGFTVSRRIFKYVSLYLFISLILNVFTLNNQNSSQDFGHKINAVCFDMDSQSYTNEEQLKGLVQYSDSPISSDDDIWLCSDKAFFVLSNTEEQNLLNDISSIAQLSNKTIGFGYLRQIDISDHPGTYDFKNMFALVNPQGNIVWKYQNIITTGSYTSVEDKKLQPGTEIAYPKAIDISGENFNTFFVNIGLGMGHDYDNASLIRKSSKDKNTNLMIQIGSNNHRNVLARSMENGLNIFSCSQYEGATLFSPTGTITKFQQQSFNTSTTENKISRAKISVPKKRVFTFYSFWGNSLGNICLFLLTFQGILLKCFNYYAELNHRNEQ